MKLFLDEIIKSTNSLANNKSRDSYGYTAKMYIDFSNELASKLLFYDSWRKLSTMGVNSRAEIISVIYKKGHKMILQTTDPLHF